MFRIVVSRTVSFFEPKNSLHCPFVITGQAVFFRDVFRSEKLSFHNVFCLNLVNTFAFDSGTAPIFGSARACKVLCQQR